MTRDDLLPLALLGGGLMLLGMASKKPARKLKDRSGEECEPKESAPYGYECGQVTGGWKLVEEKPKYLGYGSYNNREGVDVAINQLGFPGGNLRGFQMYISMTSDWDLRQDGQIDKNTILALEEAEGLLGRGEWLPPRPNEGQ